MKKLPTWAKVIIVFICFPITFKFGNALGLCFGAGIGTILEKKTK